MTSIRFTRLLTIALVVVIAFGILARVMQVGNAEDARLDAADKQLERAGR